MTIVDKNRYSHISLRAKAGVYVDFPIIDNKGLFEHFYRSGKEDGYILETFYCDDVNQYGIYKNDAGISYLISTFSSKEDINVNSMVVIVNYFPYMLDTLDIEFKYDLHTNIENLPKFHYELYARVKDAFIPVAVISDIEKLKRSEIEKISKFPGANESIKKFNDYMADKTAKAFK
ncbi:hypothetical protein EC843_101702 [Buttiauxella sp. JUb87]|uniref:hypothetical protein n=1 Tax=Buttiauxella sp. JUb87 TaxID=2485129 RepID=UPI00105D0CC3|nr:hypothetical protein [Buttiauxella sp. JUb87]TDN54651.1 hypothetical protein EC843_101702 [Buttiauxella sp. JUb87]